MSWFRSKSAPGQWRNGAIGAAGSILLGLCFLMSDLGNSLKSFSYDLPFWFRRDKAPPDEVRIIYMDEKSYELRRQDYTKGAWDRDLHAQLVRKLQAFGAKAVAFDVSFSDPWTNKLVDQALADVFRAHGNVTVAQRRTLIENSVIGGREFPPPVEPIRSAARYGIVDLEIDKTDAVVRRQYSHPQFVGFAWQVAESVGRAPAQRMQERWINYYGPRKWLPSTSYYQLFESNTPASSLFSNKVVFVGKESVNDFGGTSRDDWPTPYKRWTGEDTPGVEIQATVFLNLIRGEWLSEVAHATQALLCLVLGGLFGLGFVLVRPWIAAAVGAASFFALAGVSLFLVAAPHYRWFPWLVYGAIQMPVALSWAVLVNTRRVYHEKELLEQTLATARAASGSAQGTPATGSGAVAALSAINEAAANVGSDAPTVLTPVTAKVEQGIIGDHELVRLIGSGSYGEVWLSKSLVGIYRAVKVVYRRKFEHAAPFEREFRGLKKFAPVSMSHRGFVHILHVGKNDTEGYFYNVMELGDDEVNGQAIDPATYSPKNLGRELKKRGSLSVRECLTLGTELSAALEHLHHKELIHRDIKPSNIIFVNGAPKLADIGLVTAMEEDRTDVTYVGTPGYIAPEGPGSRAADVFSLGKVLYECAMGRDCQQYPELPSSLLARSDKDELLELNKVISKACDPDPRCRYNTAKELHSELLKLQNRLDRGARVAQGPVGI